MIPKATPDLVPRRREFLSTLSPSHYCGRARWALDHCGIEYDEERLAPGAHILRVRGLSGRPTT